jgi:hypothetical protein
MHREIHLSFGEFVKLSRELKVAGVEVEPALEHDNRLYMVDPDFDRVYSVHVLTPDETPTVEAFDESDARHLTMARLTAVHTAWKDPWPMNWLDESIVERFVPDWIDRVSGDEVEGWESANQAT